MGKIIKKGFSFDDVLLIPQKSEVIPSDVSLSTTIGGLKLNMPIIAAAMNTVCEAKMAAAMAREGGLGIVHKNMTITKQANEVSKVKKARISTALSALDSKGRLLCGAAIGVAPDMEERLEALMEAGTDILVLDSAHGHSSGIIKCARKVKKMFPKVPLIAGNVVTAAAARDLIAAGADVIKVGVGPGSICTTRVVAGVGTPQLTAIMDVYEECKKHSVQVIADGGIKLSGDIVKALGGGADAVMLGSLLAGHDEAPGETFEDGMIRYKRYVGMGSLAAMKLGSKDRYFQNNTKEQKKLVPEGIEGVVPYKGHVKDTLYQLCGGLRSGMGYNGAPSIKHLNENAMFIEISTAGLKESHPHSIKISKAAPNYSI